MQWTIRDWMRATVLLAVASACLRMGCQVERATEALEVARKDVGRRQIETSFADARDRGWLHRELCRYGAENERLRTNEEAMLRALEFLTHEVQRLQANQEAISGPPPANGPCVAP